MPESKAFRIRPAIKADAADIARLFLVSSDGLAAYIWSRMDMPGLSPQEIGAARYSRTGTPFSFENCLIAEREGSVVGMAHSFPMPPDRTPGSETDPVLRPYSELEDPGSFYVSGLAVEENWRGRGVGAALMDRLTEAADGLGLPRISLICFERNSRALAFYLHRGFREIARRPIVPHPALHHQDGDALLLVAPIGPNRA